MKQRATRPEHGTWSLPHTSGELKWHATFQLMWKRNISTEGSFILCSKILHGELNHHCHSHLSPIFPNAFVLDN